MGRSNTEKKKYKYKLNHHIYTLDTLFFFFFFFFLITFGPFIFYIKSQHIKLELL